MAAMMHKSIASPNSARLNVSIMFSLLHDPIRCSFPCRCPANLAWLGASWTDGADLDDARKRRL